MQLRKLTKALKQKEELQEGVHLIDFEQLKIENQTLNEKIEERNEEIQKFRKKSTKTVQVLTHLKEKISHVGASNKVCLHAILSFGVCAFAHLVFVHLAFGI